MATVSQVELTTTCMKMGQYVYAEADLHREIDLAILRNEFYLKMLVRINQAPNGSELNIAPLIEVVKRTRREIAHHIFEYGIKNVPEDLLRKINQNIRLERTIKSEIKEGVHTHQYTY